MKQISVLLTALAMIVPNTAALAQVGNGISTITKYYSDFEWENQVGVFIEYCDGTTYFSGTISIYSSYQQYQC